MEFEWNSEKDEANRDKHRLPLQFASLILADPRAITHPDERRDYEEQRFVTLGMVAGRVYLACYTMRGGNCRVISVRKANDREIRKYRASQSHA